MESLKMMLSILVCFGTYLQLVTGIATSHQSFSSGEGWRYSYGIVHGPHGVGHVEGESYPHGYGGFGTYAPSYGYDGYSLTHHHEIPHEVHLQLPHEVHHEVPHILPVPAVHAPLPAVHGIEHFPSYYGTPVPYPFKAEAVKFVEPIKAIHPLPHVLPHTESKPLATPNYIFPSYKAGQYYGSGYLGDYSDLLSSDYFNNHDEHLLNGFHGFEDVSLADHGLYGDYFGDQYKALYKPVYHDYYGSTSYHH